MELLFLGRQQTSLRMDPFFVPNCIFAILLGNLVFLMPRILPYLPELLASNRMKKSLWYPFTFKGIFCEGKHGNFFGKCVTPPNFGIIYILYGPVHRTKGLEATVGRLEPRYTLCFSTFYTGNYKIYLFSRKF